MGSVQPQSRKIKKRSKRSPDDPQNFVCGECNRSYKFYPGLYLHIRNKHDGIQPPNTKVIRPSREASGIYVKPGRPKKGEKDLDIVDEDELCLEVAQDALFSFLGEKLDVIPTIGPKASLEDVTSTFLEIIEKYNNDKWLEELGEESKRFLAEYKEKDLKMQNLDLEEDLIQINPEKSLKVIVWFMMWLGKIFVKPEFIPDLCIICSRIWKVTEETEIDVQDLDNKLVWKKVAKDCKESKYALTVFKDDYLLVIEFVKRVCQLIGKVYEEKLDL